MDGARSVQIQATDSSVFIWGKGFSYEFDRSLFMHAMSKELGDTVKLVMMPTSQPVPIG
ncbi:MAG: hypothetical protein K0Q52_216 [Microbacterium sp.]|jgi:hypothetical protein|nr:hypothetical protein [Microbacterium sp.]